MSARHGTTDRVRRVTATTAIALALVVAAPAGGATRILAVGDFGVAGSTERATGAAIEAWEAGHPASLLLTLGDNDYTESPPAFRSNWHDAFGWLEAAGVSPRGTLGNHDVRVDGGHYEFKALRMPSSHYYRSRPDFDLFVLTPSPTNGQGGYTLGNPSYNGSIFKDIGLFGLGSGTTQSRTPDGGQIKFDQIAFGGGGLELASWKTPVPQVQYTIAVAYYDHRNLSKNYPVRQQFRVDAPAVARWHVPVRKTWAITVAGQSTVDPARIATAAAQTSSVLR